MRESSSECPTSGRFFYSPAKHNPVAVSTGAPVGSSAAVHRESAGVEQPISKSAKTHFAGLDSLRFYAAFLVLLGHIPMNQTATGLPDLHYGAIFYRGGPAVAFFFTLSGFLITYLLLDEQWRNGRISIRAFYMRRVLRIWPLYFLIVAFGLIFYNLFLPSIGMTRPVEYSLWAAIVLYLFFLPNLMNSLYSVGGILNPSWSIGVEEQFYLMWAPVVKKWHARMPQICAAVFLVSLALFTVNEINPLGLTEMKKFFAQLKFHFMAAGAFMAWLLYTNRDRLLALPIFKRRFLQWALAILLLEFIIVGVPRHWFLEESLQVLLYSWLIVEVGVNSNRLVKIKTRATEWLGEISYGIYMYHMIAIHATSYLFQKSTWWQGHLMLYFVSYYLIAVGLTILLSYLSYLLFESPILRLKQRFAR